MLFDRVKIMLKLGSRFVTIATAAQDGTPNVSVKLYVKTEGRHIYLVDRPFGKTWENINKNPKVCLFLAEQEIMRGYKIIGSVEVIDKGPEHRQMVQEVQEAEVALLVNRVIEGVQRAKAHKDHDVTISDRFVVYKLTVKEVVEIGLQGKRQTESFRTAVEEYEA